MPRSSTAPPNEDADGSATTTDNLTRERLEGGRILVMSSSEGGPGSSDRKPRRGRAIRVWWFVMAAATRGGLGKGLGVRARWRPPEVGSRKKMFFLAVCDVPLQNKTDRFCRMIS